MPHQLDLRDRSARAGPRRASLAVRRAPALLALAIALAPSAGRAESPDDQQRRLIDIHSLLLDLPALQPPAVLRPGMLDASVEAVLIPHVDGTVGFKHERTASDHTPVFPRPRVMLGLPAPAGFRAFVGLSYLPPLSVRGVSTHYGAVEAGVGYAPGALRLGARAHALFATAHAPVTEPTTKDVLETREAGADLSVGLHLGRKGLELTPYAGAGVVSLAGRFRVTVDGTVLRSTRTTAALDAGARLLVGSRWEVVTELDTYPGRLTHAGFRLGYLFGG